MENLICCFYFLLICKFYGAEKNNINAMKSINQSINQSIKLGWGLDCVLATCSAVSGVTPLQGGPQITPP
jgi:hypothetical protein